MNEFQFIGTVGKDSETSYTSNGSPLTKFSLAVNDNYKGSDGNWIENVDWFNLTVWKDIALAKGSKIFVKGKIKVSKKDDKIYYNFTAYQIHELARIKKETANGYTSEHTKAIELERNDLSDNVPF